MNELENRGSQSYVALYWSGALANQTEDAGLQDRFAPFFQQLAAAQETILAELITAQGTPVDLGGYYQPDSEKVASVMRPSPIPSMRSWTASLQRNTGSPVHILQSLLLPGTVRIEADAC